MTQKTRIGLSLGIASLGLSGCGGGTTATVATTETSYRSILVSVQPGTDVAALAAKYGATLDGSMPEDNLYRFRVRDGEDRNALTDRLQKDTHLSMAESDDGVRAPELGGSVTGDPIHVPFDFVTPADSRYQAISLSFSATTTRATVNEADLTQIDLAGAQSVTRGGGVTVAVLDTGIEASHPSLTSHVLTGYNAIDPTATPAEVSDGTQNLALGHGTMVAGIIIRVAPEAKILPVRVLNADGSGSVFNVVRGLRWAISHGAQVVNLSFGTPTKSSILQQAIQEARRAGVTVVASAGNAGLEQKDYPASYSESIAVAALEADDTRATYSNYGSQISLAAPGSGIRSTYVGGGFATWSGTSFAAPFVSGVAALARASHPGASRETITEMLITTARRIDSLNPSVAGKLGKGVVDAAAAVAGSN